MSRHFLQFVDRRQKYSKKNKQFYISLISNCTCCHFIDSANIFATIHTIVTIFAPFFAPTVFDNPIWFIEFHTVSHNKNTMIEKSWQTKPFEWMRDTAPIKLQIICIYSCKFILDKWFIHTIHTTSIRNNFSKNADVQNNFSKNAGVQNNLSKKD